MTAQFELTAETRSDLGKGASRRLRHLEDKIPGILYGGGKEPTPIALMNNEVKSALGYEGFYSHILTIKLDGKKEKVILKDLQRHPFKPKVTHMDFQRISAKEKITMQVPLHFIGEDVAPGVKQGGGMVNHLMAQVEITCLPANLPEYIEVDVSNLGLNESIHYSEMQLPKGVEIPELAQGPDHDLAVVAIQAPTGSAETEEATEVTETSEAG